VENIRVEQEGEQLKITYRIGDSSADELYYVTLECSVEGGKLFEPVSVYGDVGSNIRGGKSVYTIYWEVFKDLEEIGEAEFFIGVDNMSGREKQSDQDSKYNPRLGNNAFMFQSNLPTSFFGLRYAYLGNWGAYLGFNTDFNLTKYETLMLTAGATKEFMPGFHFYLGGGLDLHFREIIIEGGCYYRFDKISIAVGGGIDVNDINYSFGSLGVGINF
jgi:hypothetical protein